MSKGYNFVNKLTKFAQDRDEKREKLNTTEYDEDLSFIHEKKQIPLNWDPSEFKDKVSSVWGINLDFFDFPPVSFEEESVSWKKIFRENIFQPFLPKNRIVLEHFVKNIQELQSRTLNTISNIDEDGNELPSAQPLKRKGSVFKYEYAERAIAQMRNIKKAADKHAQLSNFERRKRMYAVRANANLHKFIFKVSRLRQAEETEDLIPHRMYRIDLSLDSPAIENMLLPEGENEEKKVKQSTYKRHFYLKASTTNSREGGHRPSQRVAHKGPNPTLPIKPRRKSCECSFCGGINEKEKKAYDLPNFPQSTISRPNVRNNIVNIENYNLKGLESSNVSQDSPLSPGQSPRGKAERERDSKKGGRRFSWGSVFDAAAEKGSRKNSGWHKHQPEPPKKSNYSKFSRMKTDTEDHMHTEGDTPQSPFGVKPNKRYVASMTKLPYSMQKIKNSDDLFSSPKNTIEMKSLPMINFGKPSNAPRPDSPQEISIIKPAKPKKELKLKKKTPKKFRKSIEKNLNNTLSKFMILNAYVQPSSGRKSSTKELKLLSMTSANIKTFSIDKSTPTSNGEVKGITSKYKPKLLPETVATKKIKTILSPRTSLPNHRVIHKSDALTESTNLTSVASPISSRIRLKRIHVDN